MKKKVKETTLIVDKDTLHSFIEGGLWSMKLLKDTEEVTGLVRNGDVYEVTLNGDTEELKELPW